MSVMDNSLKAPARQGLSLLLPPALRAAIAVPRVGYDARALVGSLSSLEAKACDPHIRTAALASSSFTNIRRAKQRFQYFSQLKHFSANRRSLRSCGVSLGSNAAMFLTIGSPSLPPPALCERRHRGLVRRLVAVVRTG